MRYLIFVLLCSMILTSCEYDFYAIEPTVPAAPTGGDPVSFSGDIQPIFTANCALTGCHSGSISPNLTASQSWAALWAKPYVDTTDVISSLLYVRITSSGSPMPPGGTLSSDLTDQIYLWIEQGAQNN